MSQKSIFLFIVNATLAAVIIVTAVSCGSSTVLTRTGDGTSTGLTGLSPSYFDEVGTEVFVNGGTYTADAIIWYDFMPTPLPPRPEYPIMTGDIVSTNLSSISSLIPKKAWVLGDDKVWEWDLYKVEYEWVKDKASFRGGYIGPTLEVGNRYDVIVEFTDSVGKFYLVRIENVGVGAAY